MPAFNADAMDKGKGGVSYPPNLADAKEKTPNGQTAYHAGQWTKEETAYHAGQRTKGRAMASPWNYQEAIAG